MAASTSELSISPEPEEVATDLEIDEEVPVATLLDRLKSPRESDLARKRKIKTNPFKGVKRGKGATSSEPKVSFF